MNKVNINKMIKKINGATNNFKPEIAIVLGSGWSNVVSVVKDPVVIPYNDIPGMPSTTVKGHSGNLIFGKIENKNVMLIQGRFHYYEGHGIRNVTLLVELAKLLGVSQLILTNAAGSVNTEYNPGDIVVVTDHLNLTGQNPLIGVTPTDENPVFVDMLNVYDKKLSDKVYNTISKIVPAVHKGVYAQLTGPNYETPAEIKMLRDLGADVVGMSTVIEAIMARYLKLNTICISCVTNKGAGITGNVLSHKEVLEIAKTNSKNLSNILIETIKLV